MQRIGKTDLRAVVSDQKVTFVRVNDITATAWNDRYVCSCSAE